MTNLDSILKSRDITLPTRVCLVKAMVFPVALSDKPKNVDEIAREIKLENETELVFKVLIHLASNASTGVSAASGTGFDRTFIKTK